MKPRDVGFWVAVALVSVGAVGLFKTAVAALPVPDGLNRFAAAL